MEIFLIDDPQLIYFTQRPEGHMLMSENTNLPVWTLHNFVQVNKEK